MANLVRWLFSTTRGTNGLPYFIFGVVVGGALLFALLKYQAPLYDPALMEKIIDHNIKAGHPIEVDYSWWGTSIRVVFPK
uniref:ORF79 n=3 Tax=Oryza sativa TaxID=4530 RepID=L7X466_ORYSJ|nr:ORF79 [Oryza sativa Japonica Group]BAA18902.1 ORF79 [Oryza sativa Indica Group]BAV53179.1 hypothetical protein [Oryza sativa Indica Group]